MKNAHAKTWYRIVYGGDYSLDRSLGDSDELFCSQLAPVALIESDYHEMTLFFGLLDSLMSVIKKYRWPMALCMVAFGAFVLVMAIPSTPGWLVILSWVFCFLSFLYMSYLGLKHTSQEMKVKKYNQDK